MSGIGISDIWRSKDMSFMSLITTRDQAHEVGASLVNLELCQFIDTQLGVPVFNREFSPEVAQINELEQRLLVLRDAIEKNIGVPIPNQEPCLATPTIVDIGDRVDALIATYNALNSDHRQHVEGRNRLCELIAVLRVANSVFEDVHNGYVSEVNEYVKDNQATFTSTDPEEGIRTNYNSVPQSIPVKYGGNSEDSGIMVDSGAVHGTDISTTVANIDEHFVNNNEAGLDNGTMLMPGISITDSTSGLNSIIGTVPSKAFQLLFRLIFRATKGNCAIKFDETGALAREMAFSYNTVPTQSRAESSNKSNKSLDLDDGNSKEIVSIFVIGSVAKQRCKQLLESVGGTVFQVPSTSIERQNLIIEAEKRRNELEVVIRQSNDGIVRHLSDAARYLDGWCFSITREKMIYHVLNMFRRISDTPGVDSEDGDSLYGIAWVPREVIGKINQSIEAGESGVHGGGRKTIIRFIDENSGNQGNALKKSTNKQKILTQNIENELNYFIKNRKTCNKLMRSDVLRQPPTFFPTNKFTHVFQNICNSYGSANYHEINPAVFYMFIFPFTFSVMFGDVGHGVILFLISLFMVIKEKQMAKMTSDIFQLLFVGRYLILMMSIFSIIVGFIYNDTFALHFNSFWSKLTWDLKDCNGNTCSFGYNFDSEKYRDPQTKQVKVAYPFGVDPHWLFSDNSMIFSNSFKMKLSIIIGVLQMLFGLVMKLVNNVYFHNMKELFTCWIPEFLMMLSFFGYMVICIIYKWLHYWGPNNAANPPSLTNMFISMFLDFDALTDKSPNAFFPDVALQDKLRMVIVVIFILSLVWLLLTKPIVECVALKKNGNSKKNAKTEQKFSGQRSIVIGTPTNNNTKKPELEGEILINDNENDNVTFNAKAVAPLNFGERNEDSEHSEELGNASVKDTNSSKAHEKKVIEEDDEEEEEHEGVGDIIVHQVIHTIEYTLGCISHTASYLRLWALSLAHAQLAEVFYEQLVERFVSMVPDNPTMDIVLSGILIGITYSAWFAMSMAVLCLMESLSAFLHALRLAWIEFNSKFFVAEGHSFAPIGIPKVIPIAASSKTIRDEIRREL